MGGRAWVVLFLAFPAYMVSGSIGLGNLNTGLVDLSPTCSRMAADSCSRGTCPAGQVCTYAPAAALAGGFCRCVATTTTTIAYCTLNTDNGQCEGPCRGGLECVKYGGKCSCLRPTTTTTIRRVQATIQVMQVPDKDKDGVWDSEDNCPDTPNGPSLGTCIGANKTTCHSNTDCGTSGFCRMDQLDFDIDGVGDPCDLCPCISCIEGTMPGVNFYNYNDKNGCGCDDTDGGVNQFVKGTVSRAEPPGGDNVTLPQTSGGKEVPPSDHVPIDTQTAAEAAVQATSTTHATIKVSAAYLAAVKVYAGPQSDYKPKYYTDFCRNATHLVEYNCDADGLHSRDIACQFGCAGGHCVCNDYGDGDNQFKADAATNDYCVSSTRLSEGYYVGNAASGACTLKTKYYDCVLGCSGGKCVCGDTDGGVNATQRGTTAPGHTDYCKDINTVFEYYIASSDAGKCIDTYKFLPCLPAFACYLGACKPASCLDNTKDGDEVGVDCGGTWCPPCSPCVTGAKWAPTDGPCAHKWWTGDGPIIGMNTVSHSCNLVEVCDNNLDYVVQDALLCCENPDFEDYLNEPRESSKENSCGWARATSGVSASRTKQSFKRCLALYTISAFGYGAVYLQGYFHGEFCCANSDKICPAGCPRFKVKPSAWEMGTAASCAGDGGAHPAYQMGGHRCEYWLYDGDKYGKAGYWASDTDWHANSDSVTDVPAHASILRLATGTCVDYSFALTTILRKLGYSRDDVLSVNGVNHGYNLLRFPGEWKFHYVDTVGNRGNEVLGGSGFAPIVDQAAPGKPALAWYDYCRKLDAGCSNDYYAQSTGNCPPNSQIYGCEGV